MPPAGENRGGMGFQENLPNPRWPRWTFCKVGRRPSRLVPRCAQCELDTSRLEAGGADSGEGCGRTQEVAVEMQVDDTRAPASTLLPSQREERSQTNRQPSSNPTTTNSPATDPGQPNINPPPKKTIPSHSNSRSRFASLLWLEGRILQTSLKH